MNIWTLTKKDLIVFLKDRGAWLWIFGLPVVFIVIFSGLASMAFADTESESAVEDNRLPLVVVNLDEEGPSARSFLDILGSPEGVRILPSTFEDANEQVNAYKIQRYLLVPQEFSSSLENGTPVSLKLITHPDANPEANKIILRIVNGAARDVSLELQILDGIDQMRQMQAGNPEQNLYYDPDKVYAQAKSQFDASRTTPLIAIDMTKPETGKESVSFDFNLNETIVPGMTVLFVFLSATVVARGIHEERINGSLRRLLAAPIARSHLMLGKMLPIYLLTLLQIGFIFLAGWLLLPLLGIGRMSIGSDPLGWLVASMVIALCATSLGILLAGIARTEGQITGLGNAILWIAGFLGGAIVPVVILESVPPVRVLMRFIPHYWANSAYYDLLARGKGLLDILPALGALLLFSVIFFVIGLRKFRFE